MRQALIGVNFAYLKQTKIERVGEQFHRALTEPKQSLDSAMIEHE
jgi:hypothetical protein